MAILQEIFLQAIPNQRTTVNDLNNQTITFDIYSITNPMLYDIVYSTETVADDPQPYPQNVFFGGRQKNLLFSNIYLNGMQIITGMRCVHGAYLNQYITSLNGYLFFYDNTGLDPTFETLGTTSHLYYSDYDALAIDYENWVLNGNK